MREDAGAHTGPTERRRNVALRALIEEMLGQVRAMHGHAALWRPAERAQAEAALAAVMERIRTQAAEAGPTPPPTDSSQTGNTR